MFILILYFVYDVDNNNNNIITKAVKSEEGSEWMNVQPRTFLALPDSPQYITGSHGHQCIYYQCEQITLIIACYCTMAKMSLSLRYPLKDRTTLDDAVKMTEKQYNIAAD